MTTAPGEKVPIEEEFADNQFEPLQIEGQGGNVSRSSRRPPKVGLIVILVAVIMCMMLVGYIISDTDQK